MKKIVIDAREMFSSTGRYTRGLLENLQEADKNQSHRYIILLHPKDIDKWEPTSKRFTKVACIPRKFSAAEQFLLAFQLYRLRANLVHFTMIQQPVLYQKTAVTTVHDLTGLRFPNPAKNKIIFKFKQWVYKWVTLVAVKKSRAIITPTEFVKDDVAKFANANSRKFTVTLEAGESLDASPEEMPELRGKQFLLYVGRPTPHKNLSRLIAAFVLLKEQYPDLVLVLAGKTDSNYRRHARDVEKQEIENVVFTDFITDGQLRWLYEHCAAYVFPSLSEGFGLPGLEAMASNAPVISSNATCLPEVYGDAAHYFDPLEVEDMARAIDEVLSKPGLRDKLISAGKKQVARYSWRRMAEQTLDVYKTVLKEEEQAQASTE